MIGLPRKAEYLKAHVHLQKHIGDCNYMFHFIITSVELLRVCVVCDDRVMPHFGYSKGMIPFLPRASSTDIGIAANAVPMTATVGLYLFLMLPMSMSLPGSRSYLCGGWLPGMLNRQGLWHWQDPWSKRGHSQSTKRRRYPL